MEHEMIQKLQYVIHALNRITVSEKTNLLNLGGSIGILEDILQSCKTETDPENSEG